MVQRSDKTEEKSILSAVVNKVFITNIIEKLSEKLSQEMISTRALMQEGSRVRENQLVTKEGKTIAAFSTVNMAQYAHSHSPAEANTIAAISLERLNRFKKAWETNDWDEQEKLFEGLYLMVATNIGHDLAAQMSKAFYEIINFAALHKMMSAIESGENKTPYRTSQHRPTDGEEKSEELIAAVSALLHLADTDEYGIELKDIIYKSAEKWAHHLESQEEDESKSEARNILNALPIFKDTVLLPNDTGIVVELESMVRLD